MEITNGTLTATINPLGAEVTSLKDSKREYIWDGNAKFWAKHSPVLFPIVGCLKNNIYHFNGKPYALTRHGFARDNIFSLSDKTENSVVFVLKANDDTRVMYPFDFELVIKYTLINNMLQVDYTVKNEGSGDMPFSIGGHPAFALRDDFKSYSLKFEKDEELVSRQLAEGLITDETTTHNAVNGLLQLSYSLFKNDALVFTGLESRSVELLENNRPLLKVTFKNMPHLGIWTKDNAPFICIEPWQGYADSVSATGNITEKEGILILSPGKELTTGYAIQILS